MQEFFEETAEYEAGVHAGQRRRVAGLSRRKSLTAPKEQTFDVPGAVSCYCRCMQHMLQASTQAVMLPRESHINLPQQAVCSACTQRQDPGSDLCSIDPWIVCIYACCHAH